LTDSLSPPAQPHLLRRADPADATEIASLLGQLGYPALPEEIPDRLERLTRTGGVALVALHDSRVVGLATVQVFAALHSPHPVAHLTALVVSESVRGRGIGRRLVAAAVALAQERGCGRIAVGTAEHRSGAHDFYQTIGWEYTGRRFTRRLRP
jgi:GNAT superfamily N-acetyltransferase